MEQIAQVKFFCAKYGIRPSKKLGQNFLIDNSVARKMCEAAELNDEDYVVEVGPGFGALTIEIAKRAKKVVAVEIDKRLAEAAREILSGCKNVEVVCGDILKIDNPPKPPLNLRGGEKGGYKMVANLPYSITSAVLRKFTEPNPPLRGGAPPLSGGIVVMVQKEVAERVCAKPGEMSILSVAIQYYGKPEIVAIVPRSAFWPEPEVESAILRITPSQSPPYIKGEKIGVDEKRLFQIVKIGFSSRRKQLQNNLCAGLRLPREHIFNILTQIGLNPHIRPQDLSVENWIALSRLL